MMTLAQLVRYLGWVVLALVCLAFAPRLASRILDQPDPTRAERWLAVVFGVGGFLPWMLIVGHGISRADEYARHIFLVGIALAFAGSLAVAAAVDYMKDAGLVAETWTVPFWLTMVILWVLGTLAASLYYRLRR